MQTFTPCQARGGISSHALKKLVQLLEMSMSDFINFICIFSQPVYVIIERDEETKKIQASIKAGMSANASHLQSYLSTWDRYKSVLFITVQLLEDFNKN